MRVLIIGASKGIGLETTRQSINAGYNVRAQSRTPVTIESSHPNFEKISGDALKSEDIAMALSDVDIVIQTLGVGLEDLFRS